jgi:hypothetical protein
LSSRFRDGEKGGTGGGPGPGTGAEQRGAGLDLLLSFSLPGGERKKNCLLDGFLRDHVMDYGRKWDMNRVSPRARPRVLWNSTPPPDKKQAADVGGSPINIRRFVLGESVLNPDFV